MLLKKRTLLIRRLAQPHLVARAIDVFFLERFCAHAGELRGALEVILRQIDPAIHIAAVDAAGLAGETEGVHSTC